MEILIKKKMEQLQKAVSTFAKSMEIDLESFDEFNKDIIKNGQVQKFEYSIEILWKTLKFFLLEKYGLNIGTPKQVIKSFFEQGFLSYNEYEILIQAINDRNLLSHVYQEEMF